MRSIMRVVNVYSVRQGWHTYINTFEKAGNESVLTAFALDKINPGTAYNNNIPTEVNVNRKSIFRLPSLFT